MLNGKVIPRLVNMDSGRVKMVFKDGLHYITSVDYEAAKKYVKNPEEFDFNKILNW